MGAVRDGGSRAVRYQSASYGGYHRAQLCAGRVVGLVPAFKYLSGTLGFVPSAAVLGGISLLVAFWAVSTLPESYGKDLDYVEE